MRYIIILILIIGFWFFLGTTFSYVASDDVLLTSHVDNQTNYSIKTNTSQYFNLSDDLEPTASGGGFIDMTFRMFTFRLQKNIFPTGLNLLINFFNWFLLVLLIVCIYRIANPLSGG